MPTTEDLRELRETSKLLFLAIQLILLKLRAPRHHQVKVLLLTAQPTNSLAQAQPTNSLAQAQPRQAQLPANQQQTPLHHRYDFLLCIRYGVALSSSKDLPSFLPVCIYLQPLHDINSQSLSPPVLDEVNYVVLEIAVMDAI